MGDKDVLQMVRAYVEAHNRDCPADLKLTVPDLAPRKDGDWYYVIVEPAGEGVRAYDYYDVLAQLEATLEGQGRANVLLVPVMPG